MVDYDDDYPPSFGAVVRPTIDQVAQNATVTGTVPGGYITFTNYSIPNDGFYYLLDSCMCRFNTIGPTNCSLDICRNIALPVWITLDDRTEYNFCELTPHKHGGMYLYYPNAVRLYMTNDNTATRAIMFLMNFIKYPQV